MGSTATAIEETLRKRETVWSEQQLAQLATLWGYLRRRPKDGW